MQDLSLHLWLKNMIYFLFPPKLSVHPLSLSKCVSTIEKYKRIFATMYYMKSLSLKICGVPLDAHFTHIMICCRNDNEDIYAASFKGWMYTIMRIFINYRKLKCRSFII